MGLSHPSIQIDHLCLSYERSVIFDQLSLELEGGLCTCILGPSGCGKSTLLKILSGSSAIEYSGTIQFFPDHQGKNMTAWMSQNDLLLPWLSVVDNIMLGAKLRSEVSSVIRDKAIGLLAEAGLESYERHLPSALSGGMRQRVALLRTLLEDRPVLLMDEPFSALDALTRIRLQKLAARLIRGKTVVLVTHDPLEALRLGDRILVLAGTPARVAARFNPGGVPPRDGDGEIIQKLYPELLSTLMEGTAPAGGVR